MDNHVQAQESIQELLSEIQKLTDRIGTSPVNISPKTQLVRDLNTLKANAYILEMKIDQAEALLQQSRR